MAERITISHIIIVAILLLVFNVGGIQDKFSGWLLEQRGVEPGKTTMCKYDRVTMTVGPISDFYKPGNDMSGEYARVFVNNKDRGMLLSSSTMDTGYNDDVTIYYAANSTTYYAMMDTFKVPCSSAFSSSEQGNNYKVIKSSADTSVNNLTSNWKCFDGAHLMISSGNTLDLTASIPQQIQCEINPSLNAAFSPAGNPALCFVYDTTESRYSRISVPTAKEVVAPEFLPVTTLETVRCFELKPVLQDTINYQVLIEPGAGYAGENFTQYLVAKEWDRDPNSGEMVLGYEDSDNNDVGLTSETSLYIYTE